MKRLMRACVLALCMACTPIAARMEETDKSIRLGIQENYVETGEAGEIIYEVRLSGFRDYGMKTSVRWFEGDGQTQAPKPRGVHVLRIDGSPTDKTLTFEIRRYATAGTYYFRLRVDGELSESLYALRVGPKEEEGVEEAAQDAAQEKMTVRAVFTKKEYAAAQLTAERVEDEARLAQACEAAGVEAGKAALYALQATGEAGEALDTLPEKVYVYLPWKEEDGADAYDLTQGEALHIGARTQQETDGQTYVRVAVKNMGEYLIAVR